MQPPTAAESEWLSLIRYQTVAAGEALQMPAPLSTLAINSMQDALESTLQVCGQHVLAGIPNRADFDKLFDAVATKLGMPDELTGMRASAIALNNARVGFKHHGNQVRDETLRRHYDVAITLIDSLVELSFGLKLDDVSLLLFVRDEQVRALIEESAQLDAKGDLSGALFALRLAFDLAIKEYESRKSVDGWRSIFQSRPASLPSNLSLRMGVSSETATAIKTLVTWLDSLDSLTRLGAFGIDLQRYAYFDAIAPVAVYYLSDSPATRRVRFEDVTEDHYRAAYLFVVDSVLGLGANDFNLRSTSSPLPRSRYAIGEADDAS